MTDEIKLRECPFCGVASNDVYDHKEDCYLRNLLKGVSGMEYDLVKLFNTRPLEDKLTAENAKLRAEANMFGNAIQNAISEYYQEGDAEHMAQILENALIDDELANSALMSKVKEGGYAE